MINLIAENQGVDSSNLSLGTLGIDPPEKAGFLCLCPTGGAKTGCFWASRPTFAKRVPDTRAKCYPDSIFVSLDFVHWTIDFHQEGG
jgi:hypothetical protein